MENYEDFGTGALSKQQIIEMIETMRMGKSSKKYVQFVVVTSKKVFKIKKIKIKSYIIRRINKKASMPTHFSSNLHYSLARKRTAIRN